MVYLLSSLREGADLQMLVLLDYAIIYSGDLDGPESLHTPVPYRGGELMSRRELIEQGLYLMSTRGLVDARMEDSGITYLPGPHARGLVGLLTSKYFLQLEARCKWAASRFGSADSNTLTVEFARQGHLWGAELDADLRQVQLWQ